MGVTSSPSARLFLPVILQESGIDYHLHMRTYAGFSDALNPAPSSGSERNFLYVQFHLDIGFRLGLLALDVLVIGDHELGFPGIRAQLLDTV